MKRLKIQNFGPLVEADVDLGALNVVIGPQSSGKSTLLKVACYCTWVEKRIELHQHALDFKTGTYFIDRLMDYHQMGKYVYPDTYIEYETDCLKFNYDHSRQKFSFEWKSGRWEYRRPKVSYIPTERNLVATLSNWRKLGVSDNILDFMDEWDKARRSKSDGSDILNLGVSYRYDSDNDRDDIYLKNGRNLDFVSTSSGLQSLIPLYVYLNYLDKYQYVNEEKDNIEARNQRKQLQTTLHNALTDANVIEKSWKEGEMIHVVHMDEMFWFFPDKNTASTFESIYKRYSDTSHSEVFLEQPEDNLFAPTQCQLLDKVMEMHKGPHGDTFFIATHSPYVMNYFLEKQLEDFRLFFAIKDENGRSVIKTATEKQIQQMYDDGYDMFFNIEALGA